MLCRLLYNPTHRSWQFSPVSCVKVCLHYASGQNNTHNCFHPNLTRQYDFTHAFFSMALLSRSIGQMADAIQAATDLLNSTSQMETWTHQVTYTQMTSKMTNLGNFRLRVPSGVRKKIKLVVFLDNPSGPKRHYRISRWRKATIRHAIQPVNPSRKINALARDWIAQLLHYGLFDPEVMLLSSDKKIIKACKAILRRAVRNSALAVPTKIQDREKRLRSQHSDKNAQREAHNITDDVQERQSTTGQILENAPLSEGESTPGAEETESTADIRDAAGQDQSNNILHSLERGRSTVTRLDSCLLMPDFYVGPDQISTPSSGTSFRPSEATTDDNESGDASLSSSSSTEDDSEVTRDNDSEVSLSELHETVDDNEQSCSDEDSEDGRSEV